MRKEFFCSIVMVLFALCSCRDVSKKTVEKENDVVPKKETIYNEKIQDTFFEASFGDSPQVVKDKLESASFSTFDKIVSNGAMVFFIPRYERLGSFPFGGFYWEVLYAYFSFSSLFRIDFVQTFETEEVAVSMYNNVVKALSNKYYLQELELSDALTYDAFIGRTKNHQYVLVLCSKFETKNHNMKYRVSLVYSDENYYQEKNEL